LGTKKGDISVPLSLINTEPRIAGGAEAEADEFPYQVSDCGNKHVITLLLKW
jgi:hypothetical protein